MTAEYGSLGSFGSRLGSKYIGHNTYADIRINFGSKPTPIHGLVKKYDLNDSYSKSHFSQLPQSFAKKRIYRLSQKIIYASNKIDPVINGFIPHEEISHFHICDY